MRIRLGRLIATVLVALGGLTTAGCSAYASIPPSDIGMVLTPTGYENKVYTPGQVDLGTLGEGGRGNNLVLLQRSGLAIKEQFIGKEGSSDKEDHRCLTADKAPMSLDVRLLFALPNYETAEGKKDLARLFLLGNPQVIPNTEPAGRVLRLTAESVYVDQAQQQVRGKIRQACAAYKNFDTAFVAFAEGEMVRRVETEVGAVLKEQNVPLALVSAFVSNMKPDPTVVEAIAARQAADKRVEAIRTLTDFLSADASGARWKVYNMQVLQEIVSTGTANGHNTVILTDIGGRTPAILPLPTK